FGQQACPISLWEVASQECFDQHPLIFVEDNIYGAVPDVNYPERAYLPPDDFPGIVEYQSDVPGKLYSHKYRLPPGLTGSNVLIQWHYITGECFDLILNSILHGCCLNQYAAVCNGNVLHSQFRL
ncbi:hypothetical protein ACHAWF_011703, partial [Thalassiosira exigua]